MPDFAAELRKEQLCSTCYFWHEKLHWMADPADAERCVRTADFKHFTIGSEHEGGSFRGHAGRPFIVTFHDGRTVRTTNLWHQGTIPERFRDRLTPNASVTEEPLKPIQDFI